jgi:hypothetical protein
MEPMTQVDPTTMLTSSDFYITVLAVVTVVTLIKHSLSIIDKALLDKKIVKLGLEWSGPVLGGCSAFVPGLWDEYTTAVGVMVAAPCGFLSERLYKSVLKKMLPGGVMLTSDHREGPESSPDDEDTEG